MFRHPLFFPKSVGARPGKSAEVSLNHATDAVRHFIYLRPKGERGNLMKMERNKDVFDEVDERSGTSPRQALVAEMKRITQEQFGR